MNKKVFRTLLVCIMLLVGLLTLIACNKGGTGEDNGQKNVIVKILEEDGSVFKENVAFANVWKALSKEGYTGELYFDKKFTKKININSDVKNGESVYVKWTINKYTVTFKSDGKELKKEVVEYGQSATAPTVEDLPDKAFKGWDKEFDKVKSNFVVNAIFEKKSFKLTFIGLDGNEIHSADVTCDASIDNEVDTANGKIGNIEGPFTFDGWYKADDETKTVFEDFPKMPTSALTLVLKVKLTNSAIGDKAEIIVPEKTTYTEGNSATFKMKFEGIEGITYSYVWTVWTIERKNEKEQRVVYYTSETPESATLTLKNLDAGEYFATVKIVASKENCGSVEKEIKASRSFEVAKAEIKGIEVAGGEFTYGDENAKINVTGTKEGDVVNYSETGYNFGEVDFSTLDAGEYRYFVSVRRNDNYEVFISTKLVTIKIKKATVDVVISPTKNEATYGDVLPDLSAKINGKEVAEITASNYSLKFGEISFRGRARYVGNCEINEGSVEFSHASYPAKNYDVKVKVDENNKTIKINKAPLTVTIAKIDALTYGDALPENLVTVSGWRFDGDNGGLTSTIKTAYKKGNGVGEYSLTATVYSDKIKNYEFTVPTVEFSVVKKWARITVDDIQAITYGDKTPDFSAKVEGTIGDDKLVYSFETTYTVGATHKNYTASVSVDANAEVNKNYDIQTVGKEFSVGKKKLEITLENKRVAVGKEYIVDAKNLKINGLVVGDTVTGRVSIQEGEGVYYTGAFTNSLVISNADCYEVKYDFSVEFVKVELAIEFEDATQKYNGTAHVVEVKKTDSKKNYTITYGTQEGEYTSDTPLSFKDFGEYVVYFKVVDNDVEGSTPFESHITLNITPATLTITVDPVSEITYGDPLPAFTYTPTGLVAGDAISGTAQYTVENQNAGTRDVVISGLDAGKNYDLKYVYGTIKINQKTVTVDWDINEEGYVYADGKPAPSAKIDGNTATVKFSGQATVFETAGTYTVTASDDSGNYILEDSVRTVEIGKADYVGISHKSFTGIYDPEKTLNKDYKLDKDFTWANKDEVPVCGKTKYDAIYNGDSANYNDLKLTITIDLKKATTALKVNVLEFVFDNTAHEVGTTVTYKGEVLDASAYKLKYEKSSFIDAGTFRTRVTMEAQNYDLPEDTYLYVKVKGVRVGNSYYTIEDALFKAKSGETIEFIDAVKEVSFASLDVAQKLYDDKAYRTIKSGVTLRLSSDQDSSMSIGKPTYGAGVGSYVDNDNTKIKYKLIITASTVLEVYGNILVQGLLGQQAPALSGHTSGNHSQIINNGTININGGAKLDLRGYIKGTGLVEARNGATVYSPFVVYDFRGGTNTATVFRKGGIAPFRIYEMPNIQCNYSIFYGAEHKGYLDLYASNQHRTAVATIFGKGSAMMIMEDSTAHITTTYERTGNLIGETTLTMTGKVKMGVLKIKVTTTVAVAMNEVRFPMPWNFTINVGDGLNPTTFTLPDDYKMMTGATVNVKKNATINLTGTLLIYKSFTDTSFGGTVYPNEGAAKLNVEGVVNAIGGIAGEVHGINGGKVIIGNKAILSITEKEGNSGSTSATDALLGLGEFVTIATISEVAKFVNADNSTITAVQNKTYTYNGTVWQ